MVFLSFPFFTFCQHKAEIRVESTFIYRLLCLCTLRLLLLKYARLKQVYKTEYLTCPMQPDNLTKVFYLSIL